MTGPGRLKMNASMRATASVLVILLLFAAGCSTRKTAPESDRYAGELIYAPGSDAPESLNSAGNMLLRRVLVSEIVYFRKTGEAGGTTGEAGGTTGEAVEVSPEERLRKMKRNFSAAVRAGFDLTEEELSAAKKSAGESLFLEYQTDAGKRSDYDAAFDEFSAADYSAFTYGIPVGDFELIYYELAVIGALTDEICRKNAGEVGDDEVASYYSLHSDEYDYAEIWTIRFEGGGAAPGDDPYDPAAAAEEAAAAISEADDFEKAITEAAEKYVLPADWSEESGFGVFRMDTDYSGVYGLILDSVPGGGRTAAVTEYKGDYYVYAAVFYDIKTDPGIAGAVREDIARMKAEKELPAEELDVVYYYGAAQPAGAT